jgi:hypothetical protein
MKLIISGAVVALMLSGAAAAQQGNVTKKGEDEKVTLTGCVVKGEGGFVLMHDENAPATTATAAPGTVGTAGVPNAASAAAATSAAGRVFYWLDDQDDLEDHAGQRVEVVGELEGDIEKGDMAIERENGMVELEFKVDGERRVTIKVPEIPAAVGTAGAVTDKEQEFNFRVRRVDVDSIKTLSSTCR